MIVLTRLLLLVDSENFLFLPNYFVLQAVSYWHIQYLLIGGVLRAYRSPVVVLDESNVVRALGRGI